MLIKETTLCEIFDDENSYFNIVKLQDFNLKIIPNDLSANFALHSYVFFEKVLSFNEVGKLSY